MDEEIKALQDEASIMENLLDLDLVMMDEKDEKIKDLEQEVHIANIEYNRLLMGKPALITRYALVRGLAAEISEM
jgi:hypothetical protein